MIRILLTYRINKVLVGINRKTVSAQFAAVEELKKMLPCFLSPWFKETEIKRPVIE